jgi:hypothetical protein
VNVELTAIVILIRNAYQNAKTEKVVIVLFSEVGKYDF